MCSTASSAQGLSGATDAIEAFDKRLGPVMACDVQQRSCSVCNLAGRGGSMLVVLTLRKTRLGRAAGPAVLRQRPEPEQEYRMLTHAMAVSNAWW